MSKAQTAEERVLRCRLDGLEALCQRHKGLDPALLLIRWPLAQADVVVLTPGAEVIQAHIGLFSPRVHIGGAGRLAGKICHVLDGLAREQALKRGRRAVGFLSKLLHLHSCHASDACTRA